MVACPPLAISPEDNCHPNFASFFSSGAEEVSHSGCQFNDKYRYNHNHKEIEIQIQTQTQVEIKIHIQRLTVSPGSGRLIVRSRG